MTAQVDKVRKKNEARGSLDDDENSECEGTDTNVEVDNDRQNLSDRLTSTSRIRPTYKFSSEHPDKQTHGQKIRQPQNHFVPVPIGPSIPRRDRDDCKEWYCRLMLVFFKPWRHAGHLRIPTESWSAF